MWTSSEIKFFKSLKTPEKIQHFIDNLIYNPMDDALSVRYVLHSGDAHCFEGGLLAAAALEFQGFPPLMVSFMAHNDDDHVITVYKSRHGWGSIAKSNTTLLRGRDPVYSSIRELVMSYFDAYVTSKGGYKSLYAFSNPINLNRFNKWGWRWGDNNLVDMGRSFNDLKHYEIMPIRQLVRLPRATKSLMNALLLGADPNGLYKG
jgi:hypothetical protein